MRLNWHTYIRLVFFIVLSLLITLILAKQVSPSTTPNKPKYKHTGQIREPPNDDAKLILEEKKRYVVDVPHTVIKHKKAKHKYRKINVIATAYTSMCSEGCTGTTATGIDVKNTTTYKGLKIIATDPSVIPLHSIVKVKTKHSSFMAIAMDTGGGINNFEVDVLMKTRQQAIEFGRENVTLTILREGEG